jgi:hypothetical protein
VPGVNPGLPAIATPVIMIGCPITALVIDDPVNVRIEVLVMVVIVMVCAGIVPLFLHEVARLLASTVYVEVSCGSSQMVGDKS